MGFTGRFGGIGCLAVLENPSMVRLRQPMCFENRFGLLELFKMEKTLKNNKQQQQKKKYRYRSYVFFNHIFFV